MSVLLRFKRKIAYWSPSENEMSDLVTFVSLNEAFFASVAVYVISPSLRNPAHATLNAVSALRSSTVNGSSSVVFSSISLVMGRRFRFLLGKSLFPPLIINAMRGESKPLKLRRRSMW